MLWFMGAVLGFSSVLMGAYADHGLSQQLTPAQSESIATALRYNQLYAVLIVCIGLIQTNGGALAQCRMLKVSGWLFVAGTLLSCSGIYLSILLSQHAVVYLTPVGGVLLMIAWLSLAVTGYLCSPKHLRD